MKAACYIRVSTFKVEQEGSLENQKTLFIQYIKEKGLDLAGFYSDVESGTKEKRDGLDKMLEDAKDKKFDVIISKELSRLARNVKLAYQIKEVMENKNIHLITLDGLVDTTDLAKQNMFGLYAWIFEQESVRISSRIKSVYKSKMKEGLFLGSIAPYGYSITESKSLVVRDDVTPLVVKEIFARFLKEHSYQGIAKHLTVKGIPTPSSVAGKSNAGSYWHGSTIKLILSNPHYTGDLVQAREETISVTNKNRRALPLEEQIRVENTHEAIIDKETFTRVQNIISKSKKKGKGKHKKVTYLFTNYLYCSDCGGTLKFVKSRKSYLCGKHHRYGNHICTSHIIKENAITNAIKGDLSSLSATLSDEKLASAIKALRNQKNQLDGEFKRLNKLISTNDNKKEKLLDLLLAETIDEDIYHLKMNKLKLESFNLEEKLLGLKSQSESNAFYSHDRLITEIKEIKSFTTINRNVLQKFVNKITVNDDGTFDIEYNFKIN